MYLRPRPTQQYQEQGRGEGVEVVAQIECTGVLMEKFVMMGNDELGELGRENRFGCREFEFVVYIGKNYQKVVKRPKGYHKALPP